MQIMADFFVVDDDSSNRRLYTELLGSRGHVVISSSHGSDFNEVLTGENCPVILLDIMMPKKSGAEILWEIRKHCRDCKKYHEASCYGADVIAVTACVMRGDREKLLKEGFDDYIPKPTNIDEFVEKVEEYLSREVSIHKEQPNS
jgi:CheY-like chemotaxis protein